MGRQFSEDFIMGIRVENCWVIFGKIGWLTNNGALLLLHWRVNGTDIYLQLIFRGINLNSIKKQLATLLIKFTL